jgi:hypothetical protein
LEGIFDVVSNLIDTKQQPSNNSRNRACQKPEVLDKAKWKGEQPNAQSTQGMASIVEGDRRLRRGTNRRIRSSSSRKQNTVVLYTPLYLPDECVRTGRWQPSIFQHDSKRPFAPESKSGDRTVFPSFLVQGDPIPKEVCWRSALRQTRYPWNCPSISSTANPSYQYNIVYCCWSDQYWRRE